MGKKRATNRTATWKRTGTFDLHDNTQMSARKFRPLDPPSSHLANLPFPHFGEGLSNVRRATAANPLGCRRIVSVHAAAIHTHGHLPRAFNVFAVESIQPQLKVNLR